MQYTYNVTLGRVRATFVATECIQCYIFRMYVCVCLALGIQHKIHMSLVIVVCGLSSSIIFLHYLIKGMFFEKR